MANERSTFFYFHPGDEVGRNMAVTSPDTEDSAYPLLRARDFSYAVLAQPAKLLETHGRIVFDAGVAQRVDYAMVWHNFDAGLPWSFQGHSANVWTAPTVSTSGRVAPAKRADGFTRKLGVEVTALSGYSQAGLRYWSVNVPNANSVPIGLKVMLFSRIRQLSADFQWGVVDVDQHVGIDMATDAMHPWPYDLAAAPRVIRGPKLDSDLDAEAIREWKRACAGFVKPTVIVPEPTNPDDVWLVRFGKDSGSVRAPGVYVFTLDNTRQFIDANVKTLQFEELTAVNPEWT